MLQKIWVGFPTYCLALAKPHRTAPCMPCVPQFPHLQDRDDDTGLTSEVLHNLLISILYLLW